MIKLTTADSDTPFFVNVEAISAMYPHKDFTMVHYSQYTGSSTWAVKETPEWIIALGDIQLLV